MSRSLLSHVIEGVLFAGGMELTRRWYERSRRKEQEGPTADGAAALVHPPFLWGLATVCVILGLGAARFSYGHPTGGPGVAAGFAAFAVLGFYLLAECARVRHTVSPDGLHYRTLIREGDLRWCDVRSVAYSQSMKTFRIETGDGTVVRVSAALTALPTFARSLLGGVATDRINPATRAVLDETAAGSPPSIWG